MDRKQSQKPTFPSSSCPVFSFVSICPTLYCPHATRSLIYSTLACTSYQSTRLLLPRPLFVGVLGPHHPWLPSSVELKVAPRPGFCDTAFPPFSHRLSFAGSLSPAWGLLPVGCQVRLSHSVLPSLSLCAGDSQVYVYRPTLTSILGSDPNTPRVYLRLTVSWVTQAQHFQNGINPPPPKAASLSVYHNFVYYKFNSQLIWGMHFYFIFRNLLFIHL